MEAPIVSLLFHFLFTPVRAARRCCADDVSSMMRQTAVTKSRQQHTAMAEDGQVSPAGRRPGSSDRPGRKTYTSSAHFRCLLDGLLALRQGGILYDVVLLVEGRPIQAHRILLAASCDYFR